MGGVGGSAKQQFAVCTHYKGKLQSQFPNRHSIEADVAQGWNKWFAATFGYCKAAISSSSAERDVSWSPGCHAKVLTFASLAGQQVAQMT